MSTVSNSGSRIAAAVCALALSLAMISGTVSTPQQAPAPAKFASAYVGAVA